MKLFFIALFCIQANYAFGNTLDNVECFAEGRPMEKFILSDLVDFSVVLSDVTYSITIYDRNKNLDIYGYINLANTKTTIAGSFDSTGNFFYSSSLSNNRDYRLICKLNR